jgi:alpha-tubulin suppressor-like RCC1 family protein
VPGSEVHGNFGGVTPTFATINRDSCLANLPDLRTPLSPAVRIHPARTLAAIGCAAILHAQAPKRLPIITGAMGINVIVEVDGTVKSWGAPAADAGFFGDGTTDGMPRMVPVPIPGVHDIVDASFGYDPALLLSADGTVLGWGRNNGCSLALPDEHRRYTPVVVPGVRSAKQVAAGLHVSAAVLADGTVRAWGTNEGGLLANGKGGYSENCAKTPVPVEGLTGVKRLVLGDNNVIVLKEDGTVWGWGSNHGGELCDGTTEKRYRPGRTQRRSRSPASRRQLPRRPPAPPWCA